MSTYQFVALVLAGIGPVLALVRLAKAPDSLVLFGLVGTTELMNSRLRGSHQALATLTCPRLRDRPRASILIGGLGMGFTLPLVELLATEDAETARVAAFFEVRSATASGPPRSACTDEAETARVAAFLRGAVSDGIAPSEVGLFIRTRDELPRARVDRLATSVDKRRRHRHRAPSRPGSRVARPESAPARAVPPNGAKTPCASSPPRSPPSRTPSRRSRPTGKSYEDTLHFRPGAHPERPTHCTAPLWVARRRAAPGRVRADRGLLLLGRAVRPHPAGGLRVHAGRDPGRAGAGHAGGRRAARAARGHAGDGLRGLRGRRRRARARDRRAEGGDRRRARPALPPDREAGAERRRRHPLQGIPAHRFRRAGRGARHPGAPDDPRRDLARDVRVRLPHARPFPDEPRARALLRRSHDGLRGPGRRPVRLPRPRLRAGRRAGARHPRPGGHGPRQGEGRGPGPPTRGGGAREARRSGDRPTCPSTRRSTGPTPSPAGPWWWPTRPTTPAAGRRPTTPT